MDKDALLAAMYDQEEPSLRPPVEHDRRVRIIRVGAIEYEFPTTEYVRYLEQLVLQQTNMLAHQKRLLDRLNMTLFGTRAFIRRQTTTLADLRNQAHSR